MVYRSRTGNWVSRIGWRSPGTKSWDVLSSDGSPKGLIEATGRPGETRQNQTTASDDGAKAEEKEVLPKRGHHCGSGNSELLSVEILNGRPQMAVLKNGPPSRRDRSNRRSTTETA